MHTVSLRIVQISAEPAFVTGMTLMSRACGTSLALVVVKSALRLTFHFVVNHVNDCNVMTDPAQTNVHSGPSMYFW